MTKYFCDRCKKEQPNAQFIHSVALAEALPSINQFVRDSPRSDVCDDCLKKVCNELSVLLRSGSSYVKDAGPVAP